jgi:iron complex outermembrane receptor protein
VSYAVQRSEDDDTGKRITNSPAHMAKLNLSVPMNLFVPTIGERYLSGLSSGVEFQYLSRRKNLDGSHTGNVFLTNLTLLSRDVLDGLSFSARIYNLFNESYSDPGSFDHLQSEIPQDGRTFFLQLSYRFQPLK